MSQHTPDEAPATTLPGIESTELNAQDSSFALFEHFGVALPETETEPELTLLPIERDEITRWVQASRQSLLRHTLGRSL